MFQISNKLSDEIQRAVIDAPTDKRSLSYDVSMLHPCVNCNFACTHSCKGHCRSATGGTRY